MEASAKDGEGAGRGPCGLRNSELGPRPHDVLFAIKSGFYSLPQKSPCSGPRYNLNLRPFLGVVWRRMR